MSSTPTLAFGDDGSPASDVCWLWINSHSWLGWRVEIITAQELPIGPPVPAEDATLHHWDPPTPRTQFGESGFMEVEYLTARLDPRLALSRPADLLVVGPRGSSILKAFHLGSTAEWLLQHPVAPMLIARSGHTVATAIVCHDGSPHAQSTVECLTRLPWIGSVQVTLLVVADGRTDIATATSMAREEFDSVDIEPETVVVEGKPTAVILDEITQRGPDLVALGTRGLTGMQRLYHGSTAGAIARATECSVLLACAESAAE